MASGTALDSAPPVVESTPLAGQPASCETDGPGSRRTLMQRTIDAEARAVEEGHRAYLRPDGKYDVVSENHTGPDGKPIHFTVTPFVVWPHLSFYCDHPQRIGLGGPPHIVAPSTAPCKHIALVFRRLEREGKAIWVPDDPTGPWHTTEPEPVYDGPDDPFDGL